MAIYFDSTASQPASAGMPDQIELWNPHIMRTKNIAACLLSMYAGVSFAAPETWQFTYTGFFDQLAGRFIPDHVLRGEFTGEDINHDGIIDTGELTSIIIDGGQNYKTCGGTESPYYVCGVGPFSFTPDGELSFSVRSSRTGRVSMLLATESIPVTGPGHTRSRKVSLYPPSSIAGHPRPPCKCHWSPSQPHTPCSFRAWWRQ